MRISMLCVLVAGLTSAAQPAKQADVKNELERLGGTWIPTALATSDGPQPLKNTKVEKIVIKGSTWVMHEQGKKYEYTFTIDPTTKPKSFDSTGTFNGQSTTSLCIYEVTADTLKFANGGKERPTSFDKLPAGGVMFVFKRAKP